LEVAKRHPDWLRASIGVGQLTDGPESERRGWAFALDAARRAGNLEAVRQLEAIDILQIFVLSSGIVIAGQSSIARRVM
jgi:hypothetical protein